MLNHQSIDSYSCQGCDVMKNAFECALCSFLCDSETVFRTHLNAEHKSNFLPCIYCETLYNASHFLLRHLKATHSLESKVYRCGSVECTFKTIIVKRFLSHLTLCTVGKAIRCYHCKSTFSSPNLLILHMQGQLKILLNKAYPIDKIIRIVPSPAPRSVSVLQTHSYAREPKSSIAGNSDKNGKTTDVLPVHTFADQPVPHIPVPIVSSSSKRLSYILPKSVVVKPTLKTVQTYSAITTPQVAAQEVSVTRRLSNDRNSPHILQDTIVLRIPPNTGISNTLTSSGNLPKNSVLDVSSSGKLTNISVCQIPSAEVSTAKPSQISEVTNKTAIVTTNMFPSAPVLENKLPKKDSLGDTREETKLVTLPSIKVESIKNVSVKNTIPSNKRHCADFPKSSSLMSQTDLLVSSELNSLKIPSWQKSVFNKNLCNITYPKHCIKIAPKIMLIPVPPSSVYTVLQPEFSRSDTCTVASLVGGSPTAENISSLAKQNSVKIIQSVSVGSTNQASSQSTITLPSSSISCELETVSKNNCNSRINTLLKLSSKANPLPFSNNVLNSRTEGERPVHKNPLKIGSASLAADENCNSKGAFSSTVSSLFFTPETLTCGSYSVASKPCDVSFVQSHCNGTDHTFKSMAISPCTPPLAPITGTETAVHEPSAKFSSESEVADRADLSSLEKSDNSENILSLKSSGLFNKLCTSSYSEKNCDKHSHHEGVVVGVSNCSFSGQKGDSSTSAAKQNSSKSAVSSLGSQTPVVLPVTAVIKEELITPLSCTNRTSSISTSSASVTYIKQEVISSCDGQSETAVPGLTLKFEVASDETICDRFNDYYGDIAAVVSSHCLLSQRDSHAAVAGTSDSLISGAQQNFHHTAVSQNGTSSVCTSSPVLLSAHTAVKEEPPSSPYCCTDSVKEELPSSPYCCTDSSSVSAAYTLVTSIKQEAISACDLQCETPPLSPIVEKTVSPTNSMFSSSITIKSEISSQDSDFESISSAVGDAHLSSGEKSSDTVVIKAVDFSEVYSSHNSAFTSSSSDVCNIYKEKNAVLVSRNTDVPEFTCTSTTSVNSRCISSVTAFSASPFSGISQILSDADSSPAVYTCPSGFKPISSSHLSHSAGSTVSVNKGAVCDVTFTTLSVKPEVSTNSSLSRTVLSSVMNTNDKNSTCELPMCAPVSCHSETMKRSEVCGISSAHHSAKIFSNFVPVKLIIATPVMGCTASKSSDGVQCGDTVVSSGINKKISSASCISQISATSNVCDSQHTSLKHSTCSAVASFCESNSKGQSVSAVSYDHQSSHIRTLENNIPHPNHLGDVTCSELYATQVLPESAEKLVTECTRESTVSCNSYDECKPVSCVTSLSSSLDDRHPFLNSTNMTVRQILDKFRGKYKNNNVNTSKKSSLRTSSQARKNVKDLRKPHIQSSNVLLTAACTTLAPRGNKAILKPSVLKKVSQPAADTGLRVEEDISVVSCKRKESQLLEVNTIMENPTLKVQKVDGQLISLCDHEEKHPYVKFTGECSNTSEVLPSNTKEESISENSLMFDECCFSQLESEALSDSHNVEDLCSATDILQVARELLSYSEMPGETAGELINILQSLKLRKSEKALKEMLQPLKLRDFFKCMARHCSYTSNTCVKFSKHLKEHDAPLCTCAYCLADFPALDNLICHLMQEHKRSLFQCSLCFYRAYSQTQVCVHFRKFHSREKGHIITCSPVDTHPVSNFKENYMIYYANIAKPYSCCFCDCSFSCVALLDVIHHILHCHPVCSSYVCVECKKQLSDIFEWLIHCQLHSIHLFHCIHCAFGAETRTDMLYHISMYHANESLAVFVRSSRYLMLHLERILKCSEMANVQNLCDFSDASLRATEDQLETEVQVIFENTFSMNGTLKCLYCLCSTEYATEMQNHLYSKHSQNDVLHYCFCQSQFQTISDADFIFSYLQNFYSSNKQSTASLNMILSERNGLTVNQPTVPLQIVFVETTSGVVNLQLPLAICKQGTFRGKYMRIFKSLYDQIQSKIHKKRFKCLYCKKTERYLYKLRQHWRCCHVQTGKKFKYELMNTKKYELAESSCGTCPAVHGSMQDHKTNSALHVQSCQFSICSNKTSENVSSRNCLGAWDHHSQCDSTLKIMDSFTLHEKPDNSGYWSHHSLCCNSCKFLQSTKVPSEEEHSFCKCSCKVCTHTICRMFKQCCAEMKGNQNFTCDLKNKVKQLRNECTGMVKSYRLVTSCYCLMKCSKKARCFKKQKSSETDKLPTHVNNVKLKIFLRKLPYSVKLPVLYLKEIINLDPAVVLSDIKYQR